MIVSKYKKNYFIFITCITLCIFFEIISFFIFKVTNEDKKINLYSEKRSSNLNYQYFPSVKLALPKANASIVHYTQEFTDRFITKDILNMGFGLFDDGINFEKEIISVAIGDSFTRGTGSKDNLKNGWVELVEKKSKKIDIINLGNLGKGIIDQKYGYDLIKKFIKHDVIIYNFFTGGDYHENGIDTSASYFLNHSIENNNLNPKQINDLIINFQIYHGYDPSREYLIGKGYKFYTVWLTIKLSLMTKLDKLLPEKLIPNFFIGPNVDIKKYNNLRMNVLDKEIFDLAKNIEKSQISYEFDNKIFHIQSLYKDKNTMEKIADNSAKKINNFALEAKQENKKFIVVIHPSINDVYLPLIEKQKPKELEIDYQFLRSRLKMNISSEIPVLDLTKSLQEKILSERKTKPKLYWPKDGHYTPAGYALVADEISQFLKNIFN